MQSRYNALFLFDCLILGNIVSAQPDVTGRCVTISEARSGGIKGTDCELFAMSFCSDTKTTEWQYKECHGGGTTTNTGGDTGQTTQPIDTGTVYPPGMYYNTYDVALNEYENLWDNGKKKESDKSMLPTLQKYFDAGGCSDYASANHDSVN